MYHRGMDWQEWIATAGQFGVAMRSVDIQAKIAQSVDVLNRDIGSLVACQADMKRVLQDNFNTVSHEAANTSSRIEELKASFDWGISALLWKHEMQNKALRSILKTLQAPLDTQAKELRRRAEDAYLHDWYDEALADFLESERKNYQDFAVHLSIANIYLYKQHPPDVDKAKENYLKAAKYATPRSAYHAAVGYLHAGFACYLLHEDEASLRMHDVRPSCTRNLQRRSITWPNSRRLPRIQQSLYRASRERSAPIAIMQSKP
jgi:hypothetical protein